MERPLPSPSQPPLHLAHVHRVTTEVAGRPCEVFVFDHHRSAFPLWCLAAQAASRPLTLVSLDRHMDLMTPGVLPPGLDAPLEVLDDYARWQLSPRNDDHVVAALEAGAVGDVVMIARSHAPPSLEAFAPYRDREQRPHRFAFAKSLETLDEAALSLLEGDLALDIDLDCFTTPSDAHFDEVIDWDLPLIEAFLRPPDSERFWERVLARVRVITVAREPYHCGGLERGARLWGRFSEAFFGRLLRVPAP